MALDPCADEETLYKFYLSVLGVLQLTKDCRSGVVKKTTYDASRCAH